MATANHEKMLERVRALLAKAAGGTTDEEADLLRAKADELMTKYAIEMWMVEEADSAKRESHRKPIVKDINIDWWWKTDDDLASALWSVFQNVCRHCRCRVAWKHANYNTKSIPVVGLESDLLYVDMLFTSLFMQMVDRMDPHPREGDTLVEALVRMKEAGLKWENIHGRLRKAGLVPDEPWSKKVASKMDFAGKYTRYCEQHSRDRTYVTPSVYRRSFAAGFSSALRARLSNQAEEQGQNTGSTALVLRDIRLVIEQALFELFPDMRPHPSNCQCEVCTEKKKPIKLRDTKVSLEAMNRGHRAGNEVEIMSNASKLRSEQNRPAIES